MRTFDTESPISTSRDPRRASTLPHRGRIEAFFTVLLVSTTAGIATAGCMSGVGPLDDDQMYAVSLAELEASEGDYQLRVLWWASAELHELEDLSTERYVQGAPLFQGNAFPMFTKLGVSVYTMENASVADCNFLREDNGAYRLNSDDEGLTVRIDCHNEAEEGVSLTFRLTETAVELVSSNDPDLNPTP